MDLDANIIPAFVTPVVNCRWPDDDGLNAQLERTILALEAENKGLQRSNVGGWHSENNLLSLEQEAFQLFHQRLAEFTTSLLKQMRTAGAEGAEPNFQLEAWANVLRYGQYNSVHCHPNASWSIVYFVTENPKLDNHPFSGKLELLDPRAGASQTYSDSSDLYGRFLVSPNAGQVLAFPAWMMHQVHPHFSDKPRLSIAANVVLG